MASLVWMLEMTLPMEPRYSDVVARISFCFLNSLFCSCTNPLISSVLVLFLSPFNPDPSVFSLSDSYFSPIIEFSALWFFVSIASRTRFIIFFCLAASSTSLSSPLVKESLEEPWLASLSIDFISSRSLLTVRS